MKNIATKKATTDLELGFHMLDQMYPGQSGISVSEITNIVQAIQSGTDDVVLSLQEGYQEVAQGTSPRIYRRLLHITQNLVILIEEIAEVSEESAAGIEQTTASFQQASDTMDEVAKSSDELATVAEKLNELVRQFKL